ncbi:hypothetical protein ACLOJK_031879 [Asimina triloba]
MWASSENVFSRSSSYRETEDDEEALRWAALERLPTYDRVRRGIFRNMVGDRSEVVVESLELEERRLVLDRLVNAVDEDAEQIFDRMRKRFDALLLICCYRYFFSLFLTLSTFCSVRKFLAMAQVNLEFPKIEVRFQHLNVESFVRVGSRALPTIPNFIFNMTEAFLRQLRLFPGRRKRLSILNNVSGIIRPSRLTLLLGPPSSGKSTLLLALAGRVGPGLQTSGSVTYNGHGMKEFVPQRTSSYVSQQDWHVPEITVRETLEFSGRCQGVGIKYDMLMELSRREKNAGIKPDEDLDIFMKALALGGEKTSLVVEYVMKILGLDICADTLVGDEMLRGISGGQKKRLTTARVLFMDEISTGLDSATTHQIIKYLRHSTHALDGTTVISLLQPAPETYELFDDIILLSEGQIVYQGPRDAALDFFAFMGFRCPERKNVADFLQEVISKKDQQQYWSVHDYPYEYIPVIKFAEAFRSFQVGKRLLEELAIPFDRNYNHPAALSTSSYGIGRAELLKTSFSWQLLLMKRNLFVYVFKFIQVGFSVLFVDFNENCFNVLEEGNFLGFMLSKFANLELGQTLNTAVLLFVSLITMTVFFRTRMPRDTVDDGVIYLGALYFGTTVWNNTNMSLGKAVLKARSMFPQSYWYWIGVGALLGYAAIFSALLTFSLAYLNLITGKEQRGMVLPFKPLSMCFSNINYYVDVPLELKQQGILEDHLQLLVDVTGAFRPGVLTALVGVSGAGKTTLMDVLAGRKTGGIIEGTVTIAGYPKSQETFARVSGYCEQNDIHSPCLTVRESLLYSAWLRLPSDVDLETQRVFVEEVMELVELTSLSGALVGLPGIDGLSTEQRKRLTIAVELVANPSIVFMDEPTSGLDARSAAIVMRTLLFMKRGGQLIYAGPLGTNSHKLVEYFEAIEGVPQIRPGQNPAAWMLEVTSLAQESRLHVDFAEVYLRSSLFQKIQQDVLNAMGSMYAAVLFIGITNATAVQPVVSIERFVSYRERAAGMYSALPFAFAQVAIELPYVFVQTLIYGSVFYFMASFEWAVEKFICSPRLCLQSQFAYVFLERLPVWWRWYYRANPIAWSLYGLLTSQYGDDDRPMKLWGGGDSTPREYLRKHFGFRHDFLGIAGIMVALFCVIFAVIFAFAIKSFNFQRR